MSVAASKENMSSKHVVAIVLVAIAASAQTGTSRASLSVRHFVAPAYPVTAWLARIQGTAVAEVAIKRWSSGFCEGYFCTSDVPRTTGDRVEAVVVSDFDSHNFDSHRTVSARCRLSLDWFTGT